MSARPAALCCAAILAVGGVVGLSACGPSASRGATDRAVTDSFRQFMRAVSAREATVCRLSFPRGEQLYTAASLRRVLDVSGAQRKWVAACIDEFRMLIALVGAKPPGRIEIRGLVVHGDLATARVTGQVATVQTPGKPEQPTQFVRLGGRWLLTIPILTPG